MALLFTVLLGISAAILGYFLYDFGRQDFIRETEAAIDAEISMLTTINPGQPAAVITYINQRTKNDKAVYFRYENETGKKLAGTIDVLPPDIKPLKEGILKFSLAVRGGQQILAAKIHTFADGSRIIIARDIHDLIASYLRLKHLSLLVMALLLAVVLVSFGVSHFVVSRINRIANIASMMMATGDLSQRIAIDSKWDDLSNLGQVLNQFLAQIEMLMTGIRQVSNNIAHDLRTPLAGLRSDIEALKGKPVNDQHLEILLAEADRILAVFQALLRITNIEQGKRHQSFTLVNLSTVLADVMELYEPVAEEKQIVLQAMIANNIAVKGDADLLFQLFANLLDNAIKFSLPDAKVLLKAELVADVVKVTIADSGPGIPASEKELVFRHFYRVDTSRTTAGNGLGLSLVKAIIEQHRGKILLINMYPGLNVQIELQPYQSFIIG